MASRSNSNAAATQAQRKAASDNKRISSPPSASKLGLTCTDPSKFDGKRAQLLHTDSGYISPTVAPTSNGNSPQTPSGRGLQNVTFQIGGTPAQISSEDPSKPATETVSSESLVINASASDHHIVIAREQNRNADIRAGNMQSLLTREGHTATQYGLSSLPTESVSVSTVCMIVANSLYCLFCREESLRNYRYSVKY